MAYPNKRPLTDKYLNTYLADVSAASSAYVAVVGQGECIGIRTVLGVAITGTDSVVTVKKNGTAISGVSTITITQSGSAAGDVDTLDCTPFTVQDGDQLELASDGASSTTAPLYGTFIIREA